LIYGGSIPLRLKGGNKFLKRAVVGTLFSGQEEATGQLPIPAVIGHAFATFAFTGAGLIRTGAFLQILFHVTFHFCPSLLTAEIAEYKIRILTKPPKDSFDISL
jgi:hypothetical protein